MLMEGPYGLCYLHHCWTVCLLFSDHTLRLNIHIYFIWFCLLVMLISVGFHQYQYKRLELEGVQLFGLVDSPSLDLRVPVDSRVREWLYELFWWVLWSGLGLVSPAWTRESMDSRVPVNSSITDIVNHNWSMYSSTQVGPIQYQLHVVMFLRAYSI